MSIFFYSEWPFVLSYTVDASTIALNNEHFTYNLKCMEVRHGQWINVNLKNFYFTLCVARRKSQKNASPFKCTKRNFYLQEFYFLLFSISTTKRTMLCPHVYTGYCMLIPWIISHHMNTVVRIVRNDLA